MSTPHSTTRITASTPLITQAALLKDMPCDAETSLFVANHRRDFGNILSGTDGRRIILAGPCSIHNPAEALEYARKLATLAKEVQDRFLVLMRVYFEKPRTTVGWKGYVTDPNMTGSEDFNIGLPASRSLLLELAKIIPTGTEFLDPVVPQYIIDLITTGTIGARTIESQTHRQMASGLSTPVGFKNATSGNISHALDAMIAAGSPGKFLGVDEHGSLTMFTTSGNPGRYLILRGGADGPNFDEASIQKTEAEIAARNLGFPCPIMVDCSHGNSNKDHTQQAIAFRSVMQQMASGKHPGLIGAMLESNLFEGKQPMGTTLIPGVSVTDACIGWEETEKLIREVYTLF